MSRNIIAILRGIQPAQAVACAEVLIDCGITTIEVPLNSPDPFRSITQMLQAFAQTAQIGAGTVLRVEDVQRLGDIGAALVVSPDCNPDVIRATKAAGMLSYPGVMTPSECFAALRAGADGLKIFPGDLVGPAGVQAMRAVLPPSTQIFAVGGAGPDHFAQWKAAGADGFGIGSALYRAGDSISDIRAKAQNIVAAYDRVYG